MDFGIRELLMIVGALIFIGVLIDGARRFQDNRKKQIKVQVDRKSKPVEDEEDDLDWYSSELPAGGARVRNAGSSNSEENYSENEMKITPRFSEPLDILMDDRVLSEKKVRNTVEEYKAEPSISEENQDFESDDYENEFDDEIEDASKTYEKPEIHNVQAAQDAHETQKRQAPSLRSRNIENNQNPQREVEEVKKDKAPKFAAKKPTVNQGDLFVAGEKHEDDEEPKQDLPEEVLSVNVIAKKGQEINGQDLLAAVQSFGLRYGDMNIFHRHEHSTGQGPVIFSMANAINPGTFDITTLPETNIKGVTFFMRLSSVNKRIFVLELMVDIAKRLSNQLGAELKDDTHSVLSSQTVTHYKSRIQEYERRYLGQVLRK